MAQINLRVNDVVKTKAESACSAMGLTMSSAINIFLTNKMIFLKVSFLLHLD